MRSERSHSDNPSVVFAPWMSHLDQHPPRWEDVRAFADALSESIANRATSGSQFVVPDIARATQMPVNELRETPRDIVDQWFAQHADIVARLAMERLQLMGLEAKLLTTLSPLIESTAQYQTSALHARDIPGAVTFVVNWSTSEVFDQGLNAVRIAHILGAGIVYRPTVPAEYFPPIDMSALSAPALIRGLRLPSSIFGAADHLGITIDVEFPHHWGRREVLP